MSQLSHHLRQESYHVNEIGLFHINVARPIELVRGNFHTRYNMAMISAETKMNMLSTHDGRTSKAKDIN